LVSICTFTTCFSTYGGAIYLNDSSAEIIDCTITACQASYGCGVACEGGGAPTITGTSISPTYSAITGGGIYLDGVDATITSCILDACLASDSGGGIACINGSSPRLTHCIISNCTATTSAGGLLSTAGPSLITLTDCAIYGNSCTNSVGGGVFFNVGCDAVLANCTLADNTAGGNAGGIYCYQSTLDFTDCIIWGNSCGSLGNQIMAAGTPTDTFVTFDYCCLPSHAQDNNRFGGGGLITELGMCVNGDPLFVTVPNGDYYLSQTPLQGSDSPCLDAGSDLAANLGLDTRTTRTDEAVDSGTVDIGFHYAP
jgi:hypothetical protein